MKAKKATQFAISRRRVLGTLGWSGASLGLSSLPKVTTATSVTTTAIHKPSLSTRHCIDASTQIPYLGKHQAGIVTARPAAGMVAAFFVLAETRSDLERLFRLLTQRIATLTTRSTQPDGDPKYPPAGSGILGPTIHPDALTITVSVGVSLFDERFALQALKPIHLQRMQNHPNDALNPALCHGDLSIQFCANTADTTIHALRDIIKHTPDLLLLHWKQEGTASVPPGVPGQRADSPRNYLGFRDGSANPDATDQRQMQTVVWVQDDTTEPAWTVGGSYQVIRIIRNLVERWDRTPLQEQEAIFGRYKANGAPMSGGDTEHETPNYSQDPQGQKTPLTAHIRLANPRTHDTQANLILRRPFNYSNGVSRSGQLDMGLLFICYQANLSLGFMTVQNRLDGEPLEEYIKPVGGGFFFTLPGITAENDWLGRSLLQS